MPKYKVKLTATFTADVWAECSDETEARSIAENAWRPTLQTAGIDPTIEAVYDHEAVCGAQEVVATAVDEVHLIPPRGWSNTR